MPQTPRDLPTWFVPPAPDEANIYIAVGADATLTPELMHELQHLATLLQRTPGGDPQTQQMMCPDVHVQTCRMFTSCRGVTF